MASKKRIIEVFKFYAFSEPSNEQASIDRYRLVRERFPRIMYANKLRSIQLAMGSDLSPIQTPIVRMTDDEFNKFIDDHITGKRRKEIYDKYI